MQSNEKLPDSEYQIERFSNRLSSSWLGSEIFPISTGKSQSYEKWYLIIRRRIEIIWDFLSMSYPALSFLSIEQHGLLNIVPFVKSPVDNYSINSKRFLTLHVQSYCPTTYRTVTNKNNCIKLCLREPCNDYLVIDLQ